MEIKGVVAMITRFLNIVYLVALIVCVAFLIRTVKEERTVVPAGVNGKVTGCPGEEVRHICQATWGCLQDFLIFLRSSPLEGWAPLADV